MFKQRLLTALILAPVVLATIYLANVWTLSIIVWLLMAICALEWLQLIPLESLVSKVIFLAMLALCTFAVTLFYKYWLIMGLLSWLIIFIFIYQFPKLQALWGRSWVIASFCLLLLPLFAQSLINIFLMPKGRELAIYLLFIVWAADIGAYLIGKGWGRKKLIPQVSPGKTYEGALGGFLLSMLIAGISTYFLHIDSLLVWYTLAAIVAIVSLFGDLFISMLKRHTGIKDTGALLPGHGGILDRLDSLLSASVFFHSGLLLMTIPSMMSI